MQGTKKVLFLVYVALLSTIGLFASDLYLPALANIQQFYQTNAGNVGLSLSIYMAGFSFGQLFYGALSDQLGRKAPLVVGLALFLAGTLGCLYATSIEVFLLCRLIQSIGCCAAYVLWQPMIVDLFEGHEVQKLFTMMMALGGLSPALAPLIGGYVTAAFGWKMVFWLLFALTLALLAWTLFIYRESLAPANRSRFSASRVLKSYGSFLSSRFFMGHAGAIACGITQYLVFLSLLPFILSHIGYSASTIGLMYLPIALTFIAGTEVAKRLYPSLGDGGCMRAGIILGCTGAALLFITPFFIPITSAWKIITPFCLITFGNGFLVPTGSAYLIKHFANQAGACASSLGFMVTTVAFVSISVASLLTASLGMTGAMTATILLFAALMALSFIWSHKSRAERELAINVE
ncbi:multidrug effflux MFS transporter [Serratia rubidaea]|uniref:multidrug effflux MFS transporter n=1 Tax=Serratia rubidaea TaxID=61652 RepID=UPI003FA3714E